MNKIDRFKFSTHNMCHIIKYKYYISNLNEEKYENLTLHILYRENILALVNIYFCTKHPDYLFTPLSFGSSKKYKVYFDSYSHTNNKNDYKFIVIITLC